MSAHEDVHEKVHKNVIEGVGAKVERQIESRFRWLRRNIFLRQSVFWRIALLLIGVQALAGLIAVFVTLYFAVLQSFNLVEISLTRRVENLADEIEQRATFPTDSTIFIPHILHLDLRDRFDDPIHFIDVNGKPLQHIFEQDEQFIETDALLEAKPPPKHRPPPDHKLPPVPSEALAHVRQNKIALEVSPLTFGRSQTWAIAPIYSPKNVLLGAIWIYPFGNSISHELSGVKTAFMQALLLVLLIGGVSAFLVGSWLTWRLVNPLRQMTLQVEEIGAGKYDERVLYPDQDELGRLAEAINQMAQDVEQSVISLKATDQMRRELVANVGHDLRTPVAAVMGYIEEAERYTAAENKAAASECLQHAQNQADYLKRLINDLFELSLLDSGQQPMRKEPIPVAELLHEAAGVRRKSFQQAGISFDTQFQSGLPMIEGDGLRLLRVVDNLLGNALNYTPQGGSVILRAEKTEFAIRISVVDSGEGMTSEEVSHIFERYYRGLDARTRTKKGTGLGLAICKAIVEAHHGTLMVQSAKGKGSTFVVELPLHNLPATHSATNEV